MLRSANSLRACACWYAHQLHQLSLASAPVAPGVLRLERLVTGLPSDFPEHLRQLSGEGAAGVAKGESIYLHVRTYVHNVTIYVAIRIHTYMIKVPLLPIYYLGLRLGL